MCQFRVLQGNCTLEHSSILGLRLRFDTFLCIVNLASFAGLPFSVLSHAGKQEKIREIGGAKKERKKRLRKRKACPAKSRDPLLT